jgi:inosose dehydratase
VAIAEAHAERLVLTHWKDAAGPFRGTPPAGAARHAAISPLFSEVGEGAVDWQAWQRMLDRVGYEGWTVLEIDSCPDPENQVRRAREFVESALV